MTIPQTLLMISGHIAAATVALVRYNKLDLRFQPFVFCLWVGVLNEAVSMYLILTEQYNTMNTNIYMLFECLLYCWFFWRWSSAPHADRIYQLLMLFFFLAWAVEFGYAGPTGLLFYFNIGYCFFLSLCATRHLSYAFVVHDGALYKNAFLLICFGFLIYFTFRIFLEVCWFHGLGMGKEFRMRVWKMMTWINFMINLLYLYAVIWIPRKPAYITL